MLIVSKFGANANGSRWRRWFRIANSSAVLRTILAAAAMGVVAVVVLAVATWAIVHRDSGELRAAVRQAFATGALVPKSEPLFDLRRGDYLFGDCLILQTLFLGRDDWRHSVIDSTIYLDGEPCQRLAEEVTDQRPSATTYQYSHYIFAARTVSAPLIIAFGVDGAKQLLRITTYLILLVTAVISIRAFVGAARPQPHPTTLYMAIVLCAAAMLSGYRLEYYAQTFAHGYSELVIAGFLLYSSTLGSRRQHSAMPYAAIALGVLTGCFELLTGPSLIAVGIAVLVDHCAAPMRSQPYRRAALVGLGCIAGILMAMFCQQLFISALSDARPFYKFATHLAMRLQLHQFFPIPFEPQWITGDNLHLYSPGDVADGLRATLPMLTYGSSIAATILFAGSAIAIASGVALSRGEGRPGRMIAAVVGLSLPVWYFGFANHTVLHSLYMSRMSVLLPIAAGISLMFMMAPKSWMGARGAAEHSG